MVKFWCTLINKLYEFHHGNDRHRQEMSLLLCNMELRELLKSSETRNANSALSKAKSVVSPFFGANDFAFAYVRA